MVGRQIDRDKLRAAVRRMRSEYVFYMLDDAITLLPESKLRKLIARYLNPVELRLDGAGKENLFADVEAFQKASLTGKYYQAFAVNSGNYTEKSSATLAWTADCRRLLERCVAQAKREDPATVCQAFEVIFSLLSQIDACADGILFFADEGGSWEVGVDWETVLPPGSGSFPRRSVPPSTRSGWLQFLSVTTARERQDARRGAENCNPDATPGFAETVSPEERSVDPLILFVVFVVCRYFSRCHGLVDGLGDFFVVGVGQVN